MKFRPCIDIHGGKVKQIVGSTLQDGNKGPQTNFETELPPSYFAKMYKEDVLFGGHVIMLGKGNESASMDALSAFPGGLHIGGGITPENAMMYLDAGASHVIVTSYVFCDGKIHWDRLQKIRDTVGKKRLVLDLSCKKNDGQYLVVTDRWQNVTDVSISEDTMTTLASYCDEFLIHAADVEGMRGGIDEELVCLLGKIVTIPSTYAGGVRNIEDLELIQTLGNGKLDITVGSALDIFGGNLSYKAVVEWSRKYK